MKQNNCRSQSATEFIIVLAVILIILLSVMLIATDIPTAFVSFGKQKDIATWRSAPVGIESVYITDALVNVIVINNQRVTIAAPTIYLDSQVLTNADAITTLDSGQSAVYTIESNNLTRKRIVQPKIEFSVQGESFGTITVDLPNTLPVQR